jgi:hypothetical protein
MNDNKFVNLMTKLNEEQRKYFKEKTHFENNVKITAEMARFESQVEKYELEIKMLKEFNIGFEKDFNSKNDQINLMME